MRRIQAEYSVLDVFFRTTIDSLQACIMHINSSHVSLEGVQALLSYDIACFRC